MGSRRVLGNSVFGSTNLPRLNPLQKVGGAIKAGAQKAKQGFEIAGRFIKKVGPAAAKCGLKVISAAQSVAARVAKYILRSGTLGAYESRVQGP